MLATLSPHGPEPTTLASEFTTAAFAAAATAAALLLGCMEKIHTQMQGHTHMQATCKHLQYKHNCAAPAPLWREK